MGDTNLQKEIHSDIIFDILSRLPIKSLFRFQCVSKFWQKVIESPSFVERRIRLPTSATIMFLYRPLQMTVTITLHTTVYDSTVLNRTNLSISEFFKNLEYSSHSVAHGLFCLSNHNHGDHHVFLFNPLRKEALKLPPLPSSTRAHVQWCGLGFDNANYTYKIVCILCKNSDKCSGNHCLATHVYSLGSRSWHDIAAIPPSPISDSSVSVSAYGDLHWMSIDHMIVSFDTREELFKLTPYPEFSSEVSKFLHLLDLTGLLAIVDVSSATEIGIWVLKDYEKKEWAKEYRIDIETWLNVHNSTDHCVPRIVDGVLHSLIISRHWVPSQIVFVGVWEKGFFFYMGYGDHFLYDTRTGSMRFRHCEIPFETDSRSAESYSRTWYRRIFSFSGSLVSLERYGNLIAAEDQAGGSCFDLND